MPQQEDEPTIVTPFVPDAKLESDDFRPIYREVGVNPKVESVPEPAAPRKAPAKKATAKKATPAPAPATTATVVEELPPA